MASHKERRKLQFLITAGGTREYIDPVRFISNASSGKMGLALARAAIAAGHKATLVTTVEISNIKCQKSKMRIVCVESAAEMLEAVKKRFTRCDCLIMAAAVADYTPAKKTKTKIKKSEKGLVLKLKPTVDILAWAGKNKRKNQVVIGFALDDKNLRANAERKLREKNLDMIIANTPAAIGSDSASVQIRTPRGDWLVLRQTSKPATARKIIALVQPTA